MKIVLISCSSKKLSVRAKAEIIYQGPVFKKSLEYARALKPDKIFIISALHHLLPLDKEIEPYDVTLASVSKEVRQKKPNLKVLTGAEKAKWGKKVIEQLKAEADLGRDQFVVLAGKEYLKPIQVHINNLSTPLQGITQGKRLTTLENLLRAKS